MKPGARILAPPMLVTRPPKRSVQGSPAQGDRREMDCDFFRSPSLRAILHTEEI